MRQGLNHRFGLKDSARETLQQAQAHGRVGLDGGAYGGCGSGDHFDPRECDCVVKAIGSMAGQQGQNSEKTVFPKQGHGNFFT